MKLAASIVACMLLLWVIPCKGAQESGNSEQLQERLQDIRDTASIQRQNIENRYLAGLAQLRQEALLKAQRIGLRDRMLWTEFILESHQKQKPYIYNYIYETFPVIYYNYIYGTIPVDHGAKIYRDYIKLSNPYNPLYTDFETLGLRYAMIDGCFLNMVTDFLMDADARKLLAEIVNTNRDIPHDSRNLLFIREAEKLLAIMDYFAALSEKLENQRASELADVQSWEESSTADVQRAVSTAEATPYGTVIAVTCYNKGVFCIIEGIDEIIKVGDTINNAQTKNVKIVKIDTDKAKVEFDGNGQQWAQAVGQSPNPGWK